HFADSGFAEEPADGLVFRLIELDLGQPHLVVVEIVPLHESLQIFIPSSVESRRNALARGNSRRILAGSEWPHGKKLDRLSIRLPGNVVKIVGQRAGRFAEVRLARPWPVS